MTTAPNPHLLHHTFLPHIQFSPYTRAESLTILSKQPGSIADLPTARRNGDESIQIVTNDEDLSWLWTRFTTAVWDSLGQSAARDIVSFREVCSRLWRPFTQPIIEGHYGVKDFSKLMVRNRTLFQSEAALTDDIVPITPAASNIKPTKRTLFRLCGRTLLLILKQRLHILSHFFQAIYSYPPTSPPIIRRAMT